MTDVYPLSVSVSADVMKKTMITLETLLPKNEISLKDTPLKARPMKEQSLSEE